MTIEGFVEQLASAAPTPGGGSVSALVAALSGALSCMVANITLSKTADLELASWRSALVEGYKGALGDIQRDIEAYRDVVEAQKQPKGSEARTTAVQGALKKAAVVPLEIAGRAISLLHLALQVAPHARSSYASDLAVANILGLAAVRSALLNVETNLRYIKDDSFVQRFTQLVAEMKSDAEATSARIEKALPR